MTNYYGNHSKTTYWFKTVLYRRKYHLFRHPLWLGRLWRNLHFLSNRTEPEMIPNPEVGQRLAVFVCDVISADILYPTAEAAIDACIEQKHQSLEKSLHELNQKEIEDENHFGFQ